MIPLNDPEITYMTCCGWDADQYCNYLIDSLSLEISTLAGEPRTEEYIGASLVAGALKLETDSSDRRLLVY